MKRSIVVLGNCQGGMIWRQLQRVPAVADEFDLYYARSYDDDEVGDGPVPDEALKRCAYYIEQATHWEEKTGGIRALLPDTARIIRFPALSLNSLWPFLAMDPRNKTAPRSKTMPAGPCPQAIGHRLIINMLKEGLDRDEVYRRYQALDVKAAMDLDRFHQIVVAKNRQIDQKSDFGLGDFVESNFQAQRLFVTFNHPTGLLAARLFENVLRILGSYENIDLPQLARKQIDHLSKVSGIGPIHAPIHPQIADHFNLSWARDLSYKYGDEQLTHDEFMRRYIYFQ